MLDKEHEEFLELLFAYYNARTTWSQEPIRANAIALRKIIKEIRKFSVTFYRRVSEVQWEIRQQNVAEWEAKGYVQKGPKPQRKTTKDL